jgi:hypothetical protein
MRRLDRTLIALALAAGACRFKDSRSVSRDTTATPGALSPPAAQSAESVPVISATWPDSNFADISGDHFGPIPLDSPLAYLAAHFPHTAGSQMVEENSRAAWFFQVGPAIAGGAQWKDSIDPSLPAEDWLIEGSGLRLPGGFELPTHWREMRAHYRGRGSFQAGELGAWVTLCEVPGLSFNLEFNYDVDAADTLTLDGIPPSARLGPVSVRAVDEPDCTTPPKP